VIRELFRTSFEITLYDTRSIVLTDMTTSQQTRIQVQDTLDRFALFYSRKDVPLVLSMIDPGFTGFGTGIDEKASGIEEYRLFLERDLAQCETISMDFNDILITAEGTVAWVAAGCLIDVVLKDRRKMALQTRCTVVLRGTGHEWLIAHLHLSLPGREQDEGEAYPKV
jgi:ketosteroid isomerase-like protein